MKKLALTSLVVAAVATVACSSDKPKAGTDAAVLSEIGEAAVIKPDSTFYVTATAFMKGRILQVRLDGLTASAKRDQVIGLLKAAASRL